VYDLPYENWDAGFECVFLYVLRLLCKQMPRSESIPRPRSPTSI
jgi:hypothetical protein